MKKIPNELRNDLEWLKANTNIDFSLFYFSKYSRGFGLEELNKQEACRPIKLALVLAVL